MNTTEQLAKVLDLPIGEINALLATALESPSSAMLDALLDRFVYLKLTRQEDLEAHKRSLSELFEQGRQYHLTRQLSKLTRR